MEYLNLFTSNLFYFTVAYITLLFALLLKFSLTVIVVKVGRIVYVILKHSVTQPEEKIVKAVQKYTRKKGKK